MKSEHDDWRAVRRMLIDLFLHTGNIRQKERLGDILVECNHHLIDGAIERQHISSQQHYDAVRRTKQKQ